LIPTHPRKGRCSKTWRCTGRWSSTATPTCPALPRAEHCATGSTLTVLRAHHLLSRRDRRHLGPTPPGSSQFPAVMPALAPMLLATPTRANFWADRAAGFLVSCCAPTRATSSGSSRMCTELSSDIHGVKHRCSLHEHSSVLFKRDIALLETLVAVSVKLLTTSGRCQAPIYGKPSRPGHGGPWLCLLAAWFRALWKTRMATSLAGTSPRPCAASSPLTRMAS
jgi:hypothetical protein